MANISFNVAWILSGSDTYGRKTFVLNAIQELLKDKDINLTIITCSDGSYLDKFQAFDNLHLYKLDFAKNEQLTLKTGKRSKKRILKETLKNIRIICKIRKILKDEKIEIVHTHDPYGHVIGGILSYFRKIKLIWHWHGAYIYHGLPHNFLNLFHSRVLHSISISRFVKSTLPEKFQDKSEIIYNGVKLEDFNFKKNLRAEFNITKKYLIGAFGYPHPLKGFKYFIEAIPDVLENFPDTQFMHVGEATGDSTKNEFENLKALVKNLGIENKIIFAGQIEHVSKYMSDFDIIVVPTIPWGNIKGEGFGLVAAESMASEVTTIVTDNGGLPELIEDGITGRIVPAKDSKKIAEAIIDLLADEGKRREIASAAKQKANEKFSIQLFAKKLKHLYGVIK